MKSTTIYLLGSSGLVGQELLTLLHKIDKPLIIKELGRSDPMRFESGSIVILAVPNKPAKAIAKEALSQEVAYIIDMSSAHRCDESVPLIVPEVNADAIKKDTRLIASPNCIVNILLPVLYPLHQLFELESITMATYQAASGAGKEGLKALKTGQSEPFKKPLKNNLFCHESAQNAQGFCGEEEKIIQECRKILNLDTLPIAVRAVRVAIQRAHSIALWATFKTQAQPDRAKKLLEKQKGIKLMENASALDASFKPEILVGSLRQNPNTPNTLELFITGDQLLKGAALNAIQILEHVLEQKKR